MIPFDARGDFHPQAGHHELRRLAVRGAVATISGSGLALATQVLSTVMLARLLTPADFGVVAMVTTFSLLVVSFGLNGFTEVVIQFKEIDHKSASNLFWFNTGAGALLAIGFAAGGSLLARFYGNPLVADVAKGLSIGIFIQSCSVIHLALLMRAMRFSGTSANDVVGRVANTAVSIILASRGWGYKALVAGILAQQLSLTLGAWSLCHWVPGMPARNGKTGEMLRFATKVYGQFSLAYSTRNIDNLLVGWRFNAVALGFYKKAFDLFALTASQLTSPLSNVALAALSRVTHDRVLFRRYLANSLSMVAFLGMAASGDLTLVGQDVVRLVLGPKWSEAGRIFVIFGPGIGAMLLCTTVSWIHLSIGMPGRLLRWGLASLAITVSMFLVSLHWGPVGVAAAWSISSWALLVPGFWYAGRPIEFSATDLLNAIWKYAVAALLAGVSTALLIRNTGFWATAGSSGFALVTITAVSAIFLGLYLAGVILLHRGLGPLRMLTGILGELGPARKASAESLETVAEIK